MDSGVDVMRVYISGPMSDIPHFNFPLFNEVAEQLREMGCEVTNPAEEDSPELQADAKVNETGEPKEGVWGECLSRDIADILTSNYDSLVLLPGWATSRGAILEVTAAILQGVDQFYIRTDAEHLTPVTLEDIGFVTSIAIYNKCNPESVTNDDTVH